MVLLLYEYLMALENKFRSTVLIVFISANTLKSLNENEELRNNLSAAAHLIHGSSEERFSITYCPGHLSQDEIESVCFKYHDLKDMIKRYNPEKLKDGTNVMENDE